MSRSRTRSRIIHTTEWKEILEETRALRGQNHKQCMNKLVLDYLVTEGYQEAAEHFKTESGTNLDDNFGSLHTRTAVRKAVHGGKIDDAIDRVNKYDPQVLDTRPELYFALQKQRLIELIRSGDVPGALMFAQQELSTRAKLDPDFLQELEKTMALLAFENPLEQSPDAYLLQHSQRQKTASMLNRAVLDSEFKDEEPKLKRILQRLLWSQQQLVNKSLKFPYIEDLSKGELYTTHLPAVQPQEDSSDEDDKDDDIIMSDDDEDDIEY
mmetsp:Transcript_25910/g.28814  ORF Transcript_25910/g.28814 Transcript_25910/m.28814 type:complete len:268 (-) Transcript_25910:203-1006(-)